MYCITMIGAKRQGATATGSHEECSEHDLITAGLHQNGGHYDRNVTHPSRSLQILMLPKKDKGGS